MRKVIPASHRALMLFLQTVLNGVQEYADLARPHLHADTVQAVTELLGQYVQIHHTVTRGNARLKTMYQTMRNHLCLLEGQLDALWAGVRAHVRAHQATPDLYGYYGLTQEGNLARPRNRAEAIALATEVLEGHEEAQQMGFSVVDVSNLYGALSTAQATNYQLQQVVKDTHDAIALRKELRKEASLLYREVSAEMRRSLLRHPSVYQREVMRKYGFVFGSNGATNGEPEGETQSPIDDQATNQIEYASNGSVNATQGDATQNDAMQDETLRAAQPVPAEPAGSTAFSTNGAAS